MMRNLRDLRLFAFLMGLSAALFTFKVYAGPGHDDSSVQVQGDAPKRQADGNLFVPKPAQRQLHVMTAPGQPGEYAKTYDIAGKVIMDPNFGGKVLEHNSCSKLRSSAKTLMGYQCSLLTRTNFTKNLGGANFRVKVLLELAN